VPRLLLALIAAVALVGCGDDETVATPSPAPEATAVATEEPTPAETATGTPAPTATEQPAPEEQEGGAGDEEEARVPVRFVLGPDGVDPPRVAIPAFLAIELIVVNRLDQQVVVRLEGEQPFPVPGGETVNARLSGRREGRYTIDFGSAGEALLVTGAEVGP
jgi:hypothetical protein